MAPCLLLELLGVLGPGPLGPLGAPAPGYPAGAPVSAMIIEKPRGTLEKPSGST